MLLFLLLLFGVTFVKSARYQVVGSENQTQYIQLKSQYDLIPGKSLNLPIEVPGEYLGLFGALPPRLVSITSPTPVGIYGKKLYTVLPLAHYSVLNFIDFYSIGTGDRIEIRLLFSAPVNVTGNPQLVVNTGCYVSDCRVHEIQSFTCKADLGKFGMRLNDEFVMNIDVNTTQEKFKTYLEVISIDVGME